MFDKVDKSRENVDEKISASITSTKKNVDTVEKTKKSQKYQESVATSKNKKNDTFYKADKSRSIAVTNIYNKSTQIEKPSEMDIHFNS